MHARIIVFSIISLVNNGFQAFWLVAWLVNMRRYLQVGIFFKMAANESRFDLLYFSQN